MNRFDETAYELWHSDLIRSRKKSSPSMWRTEALNEKLADDKKPHRRASFSQNQKMGTGTEI